MGIPPPIDPDDGCAGPAGSGRCNCNAHVA